MTAEEILNKYPDATEFSIFVETPYGTFRWIDKEFQKVPEGSHSIGIVTRQQFTASFNAAKQNALKLGLDGEVEAFII